MNEPLFIAVDLGAGSGRVFLAGLEPGELYFEEVRRFHYPAFRSEGHLRWDIGRILDEIKAGARAAAERAREMKRSIHSIGVDSWGVDYGLVNAEGHLIENPVAYRDQRTYGVMEEVFARIHREEIFERTGIQFMVFNTLFQLYAHAQAGIPDSASRLLMIPDLINLFLTARMVTEYTNATTTQMINAATGDWDFDMIARLGLPAGLLSEIVPAGSDLGPVRYDLANELGLEGVRVVAPATHDTGSAVAGAPLEDGWAYISSGTWSLVGVERKQPLINTEVARHDFTNEGGAYGTVRFLKNVMGLWILESCRSEWKERGLDVTYDRLLSQVEAVERHPGFIFPDDRRFFNPPSMLEAVSQHMAESGYPAPSDPTALTKVILDSLAFRYASILRVIESLTNQKIVGIRIFGGGCLNDYLNQTTATVTALPVLAGPVEATAIGNIMVQSIASGRFASLADARHHTANNIRFKRFSPRPSAAWEEAARSYSAIERRYIDHDLART